MGSKKSKNILILFTLKNPLFLFNNLKSLMDKLGINLFNIGNFISFEIID